MTPLILIVEARYHAHVAGMLLDGATAVLEQNGAHFDRISVPGALEIPTAIGIAATAAESGGKNYDGYIALGCVIDDETAHFEIITAETTRGLLALGIDRGLCIGNGVIAAASESDAQFLSGRDESDKGGDAARACLALIDVRSRFSAR
jgi:6,7-dimethyl-8-ribityllumazine synthase